MEKIDIAMETMDNCLWLILNTHHVIIKKMRNILALLGHKGNQLPNTASRYIVRITDNNITWIMVCISQFLRLGFHQANIAGVRIIIPDNSPVHQVNQTVLYSYQLIIPFEASINGPMILLTMHIHSTTIQNIAKSLDLPKIWSHLNCLIR